MAHNWKKNANGDTDFWAMNPYGSRHRGPVCVTCGLQFCIECNPEFMETDCSQFQSEKLLNV